jgi:hypothetical protein
LRAAAWVLTAAALYLFLTFHAPRAGFAQAHDAYFPEASVVRCLTGFFWIVVRYLRLGTVLMRLKRTDEGSRCLQQGLALAHRARDTATQNAIRQVLGSPR